VQGGGGSGKSAVLNATELYVKQMVPAPDTIFLNVRNVCADAKVSSVRSALLERIKREAPDLMSSG
jgi:hypothetical protein